MSSRNTEPCHKGNWQGVGEDVREDVDSRVGKVEGIDVDTLLSLHWYRDIICGRNRRALEDASKDVSSCLASYNSHHEEGCLAEHLVAETGVQGENRDLDEAKTSIVEDGRQPNDLEIGNEVIGASLYDILIMASETMVD